MNAFTLNGNRSPRGAFKGFILEDGDQVASVSRQAGATAGVTWSYTIRWFSSRAESRFSDYCDSISTGECIEAMGDHKLMSVADAILQSNARIRAHIDAGRLPDYTTSFIVDGRDYFAAHLEGGGVRVGIAGDRATDFPASHAAHATACELTTEQAAEDLSDYYIGVML